LTTALKRNAYHRGAWQAIADAAASGVLPARSANEQWRYLGKNFMEFPDFICRLTDSFSRTYKTAPEKYRFYEQTAGVFKRLKRPDLLVRLRQEEIRMCEEIGRKDMAAQVALTGLQESAGSGPQGLELAEKAILSMPNLKKPEAVVQVIRTLEGRLPTKKDGRTNPEWLAMAQLLSKAYHQAGDDKAADGIDNKMFRVQAQDR
jgi:hypothetical protein